MRDKVIFVDFTKNKEKSKRTSLLSRFKNLLKKIFNYKASPSDSNNNKKILHYNRDIS